MGRGTSDPDGGGRAADRPDGDAPDAGAAPTHLDRPLVPGIGTADDDTIELSALRADPGADGRWLNVPNAVTFLRALLVPVILLLLTVDSREAQWWAFGIFVFAAATDSIDGWVARRWYGVTRWGQLADPIADKLLIIGALASLAAVDKLPWWAVLVIAGRETAVTLLRIGLVRGRDLVMPASGWGKAKTVSQVVAVAAFLWPGVPGTVRVVLLYGAVALTLWSGIEYAFRAGRLARRTASSDGG